MEEKRPIRYFDNPVDENKENSTILSHEVVEIQGGSNKRKKYLAKELRADRAANFQENKFKSKDVKGNQCRPISDPTESIISLHSKVEWIGPDSSNVADFSPLYSQCFEGRYKEPFLLLPYEKKCTRMKTITGVKSYLKSRFKPRPGKNRKICIKDFEGNALKWELIKTGSTQYKCASPWSDIDLCCIRVIKSSSVSLLDVRHQLIGNLISQPGNNVPKSPSLDLDERQNRFNLLSSSQVGSYGDILLLTIYDTRTCLQVDITFVRPKAQAREIATEITKCIKFISEKRPETKSVMEGFRAVLELFNAHGTRHGGVPNIVAITCVCRS